MRVIYTKSAALLCTQKLLDLHFVVWSGRYRNWGSSHVNNFDIPPSTNMRPLGCQRLRGNHAISFGILICLCSLLIGWGGGVTKSWKLRPVQGQPPGIVYMSYSLPDLEDCEQQLWCRNTKQLGTGSLFLEWTRMCGRSTPCFFRQATSSLVSQSHRSKHGDCSTEIL